MLRVLPVVLLIALAVYAVISCIQTEDFLVRGLPKPVWVFVILFFPLVGSIAWFVAGRPQRRKPPGQGGRTHRPPPPRGPDDDPDFLRRL